MSDPRNSAVVASTSAGLTRPELLMRWHAARRRRDLSPLESEERRVATIEVGELEVRINALDVEASEGRPVQPVHRVGTHHS